MVLAQSPAPRKDGKLLPNPAADQQVLNDAKRRVVEALTAAANDGRLASHLDFALALPPDQLRNWNTKMMMAGALRAAAGDGRLVQHLETAFDPRTGT